MGKKIMIFLILSMLLGCGKDPVILTTSEEKKVLIEQVISGDEGATKELKEIKEKLRNQMEKGQIEAKAELEEWESIESWEQNMGTNARKKAKNIKF